MSQQIRCQ